MAHLFCLWQRAGLRACDRQTDGQTDGSQQRLMPPSPTVGGGTITDTRLPVGFDRLPVDVGPGPAAAAVVAVVPAGSVSRRLRLQTNTITTFLLLTLTFGGYWAHSMGL